MSEQPAGPTGLRGRHGVRKAALSALAVAPMLLAAAAAAQPASPPAAPVVADADGIVGPAFHVGNLARSIKFYQDVLGMRVAMQFGRDGKPLNVRERAAKGQLGEGAANTTMIFGNSPSPMIMLLPENPAAPRKIEPGYGYARLAMRIADLPALNEKLKAAGFTPGEIRGAHGMFQVMMVPDPDGYIVELIERNPAKK